MKVFGIEITEAQQQAAIDRMRLIAGERGVFESHHVEQGLTESGVPRWAGPSDPVAMRAADRIIQRERKAGRIKWAGIGWKFEENQEHGHAE